MTKNYLINRMLCCLLILTGLFATQGNAQCIIGTGTVSTAGSGSDPIDGFFNFFRYQTVYTAAELTAGGMSAGSVINALGFSVTETNGPGSIANYTIRLGHTAATNSASNNTDPLTTVKNAFSYTPVVQAAGSFHMISFDATFTWNGTSNIVVDICAGSIPYLSPYGGVRVTTLTNGSRRVRCDGCGSQCAVATNTANANRPNIRFNFAAGGPCVGTPAPGNTLASANPVCSGANFTLSLQTSTNGTGVSYQWQRADDAAFTVNLTNLGTASTQVTNQTSAKYYRCQVTCSAGPSTGTSNPILVNMNSSACLCFTYCNSAFTNVTYEFITNVNFAGINNSSGATIGGPVNYTGFSGSVQIGVPSTCSVTIDPDADDYIYVWIDWNQNGILSDAGEQYTVAALTAVAGPHSLSITPPGTALVGNTRMRVMVDYQNAVPNPCRSATYGEAEDYCLTVSLPPACSGTPTPGTASASPTTVCQFAPTTLSVTGFTSGSGIAFQWQTSTTSGSGYVDIPGATTASYAYSPSNTPNEYIVCKVTCTNSGLNALSNEVTLTVNPGPNPGTNSGPTTGETYQNLNYILTGYTNVGTTLMWQYATASASGPYTNLGLTTDNININANGAATYYIRCRVDNGSCQSFSNVIAVVITVDGDDVCAPIALALGNNGPFTNSGATSQVGEVTPPGTGCQVQTGWCGTGYAINSVWFSFTPAVSGKYSFGRANNLYNSWDSEFALYSAASCSPFGGFTLLAANDDSIAPGSCTAGACGAYIAPVCLTGGTTYYLLVDGYQAGVDVMWGINVSQGPNANPVIGACPSDITQNNDAGVCTSVVTWTNPTATDDCGGATVACVPASGSAFPEGTTTVTCTATDASNATSTCAFDVTVNVGHATDPTGITTNALYGQICSPVRST